MEQSYIETINDAINNIKDIEDLCNILRVLYVKLIKQDIRHINLFVDLDNKIKTLTQDSSYEVKLFYSISRKSALNDIAIVINKYIDQSNITNSINMNLFISGLKDIVNKEQTETGKKIIGVSTTKNNVFNFDNPILSIDKSIMIEIIKRSNSLYKKNLLDYFTKHSKEKLKEYQSTFDEVQSQ